MKDQPVKQFPDTPFFAIFSEFDAPAGNLMVMVREIQENGFATLRYLKPDAYNREWFTASVSLITPVRDFGVTVEREGTCIRAVRVGDSVATYEDGEPRKWQERWPEWHPYNPDLDIIVQWAIEKHGKDARFVATIEESIVKDAEELRRVEGKRDWEATKDAWPGVPA